MVTTYISELIHFHRKKAGLSRVTLAKLSGVGKGVIYNIEHGKPTVQLDTLLKIFKVLNIEMKFHSPLIKNFEKNRELK